METGNKSQSGSGLIEIIPVEDRDEVTSVLVGTMNLGKPKKNASFSASMRLEEEVQVVRNPSVKLTVKTWEGATIKRKFKHHGVELMFNRCLVNFLFFYRYMNESEA
jgi:hypothetical protein